MHLFAHNLTFKFLHDKEWKSQIQTRDEEAWKDFTVKDCNNHATKISVGCNLPPALLLYLLAGGCHFVAAQSP